MSYNPGGWNDNKLKVYGIIALLLCVAAVVAGLMGWIE